jgi:hypothetical protein
MKRTSTLLLVVGVLAWGCKPKGTTTDQTADASVKSAESAVPSASASAQAPQDIPVDQFLSKIAPATCQVISQCKNDKVKATMTTSVLLIASFGSLDKPDLQKQMSGIDKGMKADKRWLPNDAECATIGNVALQVLGLKAEVVKEKTGKTMAYDGKKAASCLASLATPPDPCKTEVKLATEPKFSEIDKFSKELDSAMDAYANPCKDVVTGTVALNGACEYDLECKDKDAKCQAGKKDKKARTCQPKSGHK